MSRCETDLQAKVPDAWGLTTGEAKVFRALLSADALTRGAIATAAEVSGKSVDVLIHRIRTKLSRHQLEIETVSGKGWRLLGRETWRRALAAL